MASAKFQGNRFKIDGEIAENHAILVDHFKFDGEYRLFGPLLAYCSILLPLHWFRIDRSKLAVKLKMINKDRMISSN